jgi:outer membrane protein OmpA-like peptidoglycan-associated protein
MHRSFNDGRAWFAAASIVGLAACSGTPQPNAALDQAHATYAAAANNPQVVEKAALELKQAKDALDQADAIWHQKGDRDQLDYYAYLANRRAQVAEQTADLKTAQDRVNNAATDRAQTMLQSRTSQAESAQQRASQAEQRADQLQAQLADLHAKQQQGGYVLTLGDVLFTTGRADLKPGAASSIDQLAAFLQQQPARSVLIKGFTDSTGSEDFNLRLSELRADAVRDALAARGIDPGRIQTRGFGQAMPVASNNNEAGRQLNRRVQVVISDPNGRFPAGGA